MGVAKSGRSALRHYVNLAGRLIELGKGETHIGRGDACEIRFQDSLVSRQHARILSSERQVFIEDLGSRNGTRLNTELVDAPRRLHHGDRIQIGPYELLFVEAEVPATSLSEAPGDDATYVREVPWVAPVDSTNTTGRWPLEMLIELLGRSILAENVRDAAGIMTQAMAAVEGAISTTGVIDPAALEPLWQAALWLGKTQQNPKWIHWARSVYIRASMPEPPMPEGFPGSS